MCCSIYTLPNHPSLPQTTLSHPGSSFSFQTTSCSPHPCTQPPAGHHGSLCVSPPVSKVPSPSKPSQVPSELQQQHLQQHTKQHTTGLALWQFPSWFWLLGTKPHLQVQVDTAGMQVPHISEGGLQWPNTHNKQQTPDILQLQGYRHQVLFTIFFHLKLPYEYTVD